VHQSANFHVENELKLTYLHLQFQNFPGFIPPDPHYKEEGKGWDGRKGDGKVGNERGGRKRREGEEMEGRGYDLAPKINSRIGQC
jgi:hypothetical protein